MAGVVTKVVAKKVLKDNKYFKDPYYEEVQIKDKRGRVVKVKKQKRREEFLFIPEHDRQILLKFRKWAFRLDNSIGNVAGLSSIIGLIPVVGDGLDFLMALWLINCALRISGGKDAKDVKKMRSLMMGNLLFDGAIGLVPFFGDIADTIFKCNTRNAVLLEHLLTKRARKETGPLDPSEKLAPDKRIGASQTNPNAHPNPSAKLSSSASPSQRDDSPLDADRAAITGRSSSQSEWMKNYVIMTKEWLMGLRRGNKGTIDVEKGEVTGDPRTRA